MTKNPYFEDKKSKYFEDTFFYKNQASSLLYIYLSLTLNKKTERSNDGKYGNFCYRRTDRLTDWLTVLVS